jgi:2-polyprenyl-6-methoxyphenol hydroxylase-like FAD-dependent oxidoreductase
MLEAIRETPDGVVARFSDGSSVEGPALIGADGIHSRTRTSYFPEAPSPSYTGILNLGGIVATDLADTGRTMRMVFGRRAFFGYAVRPSGHTYWFSNFSKPDEPARQELTTVDGSDYREHLVDLHRDGPPEVIRILRAINAPIGAYAVYDITSLPRWHRGRVCLVGDAAHAVGPHVGQGSSLALEDASVLARCLTAHDTPVAAFAAFERQRRNRVEAVVRYSRRTGKQKVPRSWFGRKVRDLVLPVFLRKGAEAAARLYEGDAEVA